MAIDSAAVWGKDVADAIKAVGVVAGTPVDDTQLEAVWAAIKGEDRTQITVKALVTTTTTSTGATGVGTPGGPLPIVAVPGTGTGGIT